MSVIDVERRASASASSAVESAGWSGGVLATVKSRLGAKEFRRRMWHMSPGLLPILLWPIPHNDPISPILLTVVSGIVVALAVAIFVKYRYIARWQDRDRINCVVGYAGAVIGSLLLFPSAAEVAFAVLGILAFGDGSATIAGRVFRGRSLPWNPDKTWSGFVAFLVFGALMSALLYWGETYHNAEFVGPPVSFATAMLICGTAVIACAIMESIRSRIDDNIRVGLTAVVFVPLMHWLVVGWH